MKNLKFLLLFVLSSFTLLASNQCWPTDHSTTMSSSHTYYDSTDNVYYRSNWNWNNKNYYIQVAEAGHIDISIVNNNGGDVRFNVGMNTCPSWQGSVTSWSRDFTGPEDFNIFVSAFKQRWALQNYTLIIRFTPVGNRPPVADNVSAHTKVNTPVTIHLSATDPDGDSIQSYPIVTGPSHGTLSGAEPDITYTPDSNYTGNDTFTYQAIDSHGNASNTATVTVSVTINNPPAAQDDNASTYLGTAVTINVLSNDSDPDGDPLSVTGTSNGPAHGSVTINGDNTVTYTPNSGYIGADSFDYTISDGFGGNDTATVTIDIQHRPPANLCTQTGSHQGYRDFCLRYQDTTYGNMVTIGNTILVAPGTDYYDNYYHANCSTYRNGPYIDDAQYANNYYELCAFYDDDNVNFPTTQAQLPLPNHSDLEIEWAGLYWQALTPNGTNLTNMVIKLKHKTTSAHSPGDTYHNVRFKVLNWGRDVGYTGYTSYSAFADVTQLFKNNHWKSGYITVGDIPVQEGKIPDLGTYGAWTLVVIYKSQFEKYRNFSIYDGWKQVDDSHPDVDINISGFYAPKRTPIAAETSVFTAEGDKHIPRDSLKAKPSKKTNWTTLRPPGVTDQTFNSSIHVVTPFTRSPDPTNNQGIDIQAFNLGTTGYDIIEPRESAIAFKFTSDQDRYWPSMIAFNSELLVPTLCYDYDLRIGDFRKITPTDVERREFAVQQPASSEPLRTKVLIRSLESDFEISNAKYYLAFHPVNPNDGNLTYNPNSSYVSWEGLNAYVHVNDLNSSNGMIPIGHDADIMPNGGILDMNESNYMKQDFNITNRFTGSFDVHVKGSIVFVPEDGPIDYEFSTDAPVGSSFRIDRCPTNPVYDPIWGPFNVENASATFSQSEYRRFPLYTQIAGRPFSVTVASYDPNQPSVAADSNTTVEVEIIDVSAFDNNQSVGYDITCEEPTSRGMGAFVRFDQQHRNRVSLNIPSGYPGFDSDLTLRNAAFRVWVLTHENNATHRRDIVDHHCSSATDHACFDQLYANVYKNKERLVTDKCDAKCTNSSGNTCYQCLRTYAGKPYCSRDNFSIRPALYKISVFDDSNASALDPSSVGSAIADNTNPNDLPLIARYPYPMILEARNYSDTGRAKEYYGTFSDSYTDHNATLTFTLPSNNCADDSNYTIAAFNFFDGDAYQTNSATGTLSPYINLTGPNAGTYSLNLTDSSWTLVDQETYRYQTQFNDNGTIKHHPDCDLNNPTLTGTSKAGCYISSNVASSGSGRSDYYDLNLSFHPDHFLFDNLVLKVEPRNDTTTSWLYMSDLNRSTAMAVTLEGNVSARGADNTTLSNFIDQCAANPVDLNMNLIQTPTDLRSDANNSVPFQHRFETLNVSGNPFLPTDANATETLGSALFGQNGDSNGSASFKFYYNFKKPLQEYVNVADVNFTSMDANGTTADQAWGYNSSSHLPNGAKDINITRHFYFAQIVAKDSDGVLDSLTPRDESGSTHPLNLYVEIYCEDNASGWPGCTTLDGVGTLDAGTNLFRASKVNTWMPSRDGQVISIDRTDSNDTAGTHATITPNNAITFNNDASSPQITVAYTAASNFRPETAIGVVNPDPWLLFDQNYSDGKPRFRIRFINELFYWKGEGEVGHVIDIPSAGKNNRLGW